MKTTILVMMLGAMSTTAIMSTRIYLLLAENKAQAVAAEQKMRDVLTNKGAKPELKPWKDKGLW